MLVSSGELAGDWERYRTAASRFTYGWGWLDDAIGGPLPGSLTVVGAYTNIGKSFFVLGALSLMAHVGPVLYVSLEDPPAEVGRRLSLGLAHHNLWVAFPDTLTVSGVARATDDWARRVQDPAGVCFDYLTCLAYDGATHPYGKADEVTRVLAELKGIGRRHGVPCTVVSQIRRRSTEESASPERGVPPMSTLKESGNIENMAEVVVMLGGVAGGAGLLAEVAKAKSARIGARQRYERGPGGQLRPANGNGV
jgi:replicative DNA helicase